LSGNKYQFFKGSIRLSTALDEKKLKSLVLTTTPDNLNYPALLSLAAGDVMVIRVAGFIDSTTCALIAQRAEGHGYSPYLNVPSVRRIGMAFYETENKADLVDDYFKSARLNIANFRAACAPYLSPIDKLRCTLDEVWPSGANLQTLDERKMFIGLSRMVEAGTTFLAHHDKFSEDAPGYAESTSLLAQFGANVYIQMPESGGDLVMWEKEISTPAFDELRGDAYGVSIERLGKPDVTVTPTPGDLFIFNSRKMHAVLMGTGRSRLALSCFVGYRGPSQPLTFWS
jgi:2OG-Fe(II) oxygenase superfamily